MAIITAGSLLSSRIYALETGSRDREADSVVGLRRRVAEENTVKDEKRRETKLASNVEQINTTIKRASELIRFTTSPALILAMNSGDSFNQIRSRT